MTSMPLNSKDVLLLPGMLSVFGVFILIFALISFKSSGNLPKFRWAALLFFIAAVVVGWGPFSLFVGSSVESAAYQTTVTSNSFRISHYIAIAGPILLILIYGIAEMQLRKKAANDGY